MWAYAIDAYQGIKKNVAAYDAAKKKLNSKPDADVTDRSPWNMRQQGIYPNYILDKNVIDGNPLEDERGPSSSREPEDYDPSMPYNTAPGRAQYIQWNDHTGNKDLDIGADDNYQTSSDKSKWSKYFS